MADEIMLALRFGLGALFLVAAVMKLRDRGSWQATIAGLGLGGRATRVTAVAVPAAEAGTAALLLVQGTARAGGLAAAAILLGFAAVGELAHRRGLSVPCRCFGEVSQSSLGRGTAMRNSLLAVPALAVAAAGPGTSPGEAADAVAGLSGTALALLIVSTVLSLALIGLGLLVAGLVRDHGRLLLRFEALEGKGGSAHPAPEAMPAGSEVPPFVLATLTGGELDSLQLNGDEESALVFADAGCGPCQLLYPELRRLQLEGTLESLWIIGSGDQDAIRAAAAEHGLEHVALDPDGSLMEAFGSLATPGAVLVRGGRTSSKIVFGRDAILPLLGARPLELAHIDPDLEVSTP